MEKSRNRYGEAEVGTTVLLAIPDVDKGRCELPNLKCVVLEKTWGRNVQVNLRQLQNNKSFVSIVLIEILCRLGCATGKLESVYSRNQFSPTITSFLKPERR